MLPLMSSKKGHVLEKKAKKAPTILHRTPCPSTSQQYPQLYYICMCDSLIYVYLPYSNALSWWKHAFATIYPVPKKAHAQSSGYTRYIDF